MGCCSSKKKYRIQGYELNERPVGDSIHVLPGKLREKIWRFLDLESKKALRSTCSVFRKEVDLFSGLNVSINDHQKGNLDFVKSVEVTGCAYVHLSDNFFDPKPSANGKTPEVFRCHWNLSSVQLWGRVSNTILQNMVLKCSHTLTSIIFKPLALLNRPINVSLPGDSGGFFLFPSLTTLIFHYGQFDTPTQDFKIYNINMKFILKTFSCPKLRYLKVLPTDQVMKSLYEEQKIIDHTNLRWESSPFLKFIEKHR